MKIVIRLFAMLILTQPPVSASSKSIMVGVCGDEGVRISIPIKPTSPSEGDDHQCCQKGCHAANERRKKGAGNTDGNRC